MGGGAGRGESAGTGADSGSIWKRHSFVSPYVLRGAGHRGYEDGEPKCLERGVNVY